MVTAQTVAQGNEDAADEQAHGFDWQNTDKFKYDLLALKIVSSLNQHDCLKSKIFPPVFKSLS